MIHLKIESAHTLVVRTKSKLNIWELLLTVCFLKSSLRGGTDVDTGK